MPLKARSTTGRVCPEHVSGVCLMAMAEVAGDEGRRSGGSRTGPVEGHESPPAGQEAAIVAVGEEMTRRKRSGAETAAGGERAAGSDLGAGAQRSRGGLRAAVVVFEASR